MHNLNYKMTLVLNISLVSYDIVSCVLALLHNIENGRDGEREDRPRVSCFVKKGGCHRKYTKVHAIGNLSGYQTKK